MDKEKKVTLPLTLPIVCWRLLGMYLVGVNRDVLEKDLSQGNWKDLIESLLEEFTVQNAQSIRGRFDEIQLELHKRAIPRFFSLDQLIAIANAEPADIPGVFSISKKGRKNSNRAQDEERRALLGAARGSTNSVVGLSRRPRPIRGRSLQLTPALGIKTKKARKPKRRRNADAGSSSGGLFADT